MSQNKNVKFYNLGTMIRKKPKNASDPDEVPKFYIKLEQQKDKDGNAYGDQIFPITLANGVVLNDGDILNMRSSRDKFQAMVDNAKLTQEKADFLSSFLKFEILAIKDDEAPEGNDRSPKNDSDEIDF